jgi:hypothetical protein
MKMSEAQRVGTGVDHPVSGRASPVPQAPDCAVLPKSAQTSLIELAVLGALVEFVLWVLGPRLTGNVPLVAFYWLLVAFGAGWVLWWSPFHLHCDSPHRRGWRRPGEPACRQGTFGEAWPSYLGVTAGLLLLIVVAGMLRNGAVHSGLGLDAVARRLAIYLVFGTVQAMLFFGFAMARFQDVAGIDGRALTPGKRLAATGMAALYFAVLHLPNLPLMGASLVAGFVWGNLFIARPNVWLLGASHAVLGTALHAVVGFSARIGPFYHHPEHHILRVVVPGLRAFIGSRF